MSKRISIDLGTKNTRIAEQGSGILLCEPTLAAIDTKTGTVTDDLKIEEIEKVL